MATLYDRLVLISARAVDDRVLSPGEAAYLVKVLNESGENQTKFDLTYEQIVQLHAEQIIDKDEARAALGL